MHATDEDLYTVDKNKTGMLRMRRNLVNNASEATDPAR
jgi:hypothetical protein